MIDSDLHDDASDAHRPHTARYSQKREQIVQTAARKFNVMGVRGATLEDIAQDVGMNLTSIRHYFRRKEDLVAAAFQHSIDAHTEFFSRALDGPDPEARVRRLVHEYFSFRRRIRTGETPQVMVFGDMRSLGEQHAKDIWPRYVALFRIARSILSPSSISEVERLRVNARAHYLISHLIRSVFWLPDYPDESLERVERMFLDILFNGVAAPGRLPGPAPVRPPAEPPAQTSREGFLLAATRQINEQGYRGASVERIAARLNRTKGAFYHHVDAKGDLMLACFDRTLGILKDAQNRAIAAHSDGLSQAHTAVADLVCGQQTPDGPLLRSSALMSVEPARRDPMVRQLTYVVSRFIDIVTDGQLDGSIRLCDARLAGEMLIVTVNSAAQLRGWAHGATPENVVDLYVKPVFHGLFA